MSKVNPTLIPETDLHEQITEAVQNINSEITPDNPIAPYLSTFNTMFQLFDEAYERNLKLVQFCREMNSTVIANANKISNLVKYTGENKTDFESLRAEYSKAQSTLKEARARADERRAELQQLRKIYYNLKQALQPSEDSEKEAEQIENDRTNLQEQIDTASNLLANTNKEIEYFQNEIKQIEADLQNYDDQIENVHQSKMDAMTNINQVDKITQELIIQRKEKETPISEVQKHLKKLSIKTKDMELQVSSLKCENTKITSRTCKKPKELRDLLKLKENNLDQKQFSENKIAQMTFNLENLNAELLNKSEENNRLTKEYISLLDEHHHNLQEKNRLANLAKQMKNQLATSRITHIKKTNETRQANYSMIHEKMAFSEERQDYLQLKKNCDDMSSVNQSITLETTQSKQTISMMQAKIDSLKIEINQTIAETDEIEQNAEAFEEQVRNNTREIEERIAYHRQIKNVIDHQSELIKKLQQEKSSFKRQYEKSKDSQNELQSQYEQLVSSIELLTDKVDKIVEKTQMNKILKAEANIASESLEKMRATTIAGINKSIESTEKLQAEQRTLQKVIEDTENHQRLQVREYHIIGKNYEMLQNQLELKNRMKDKLSDEKESIEALRTKGEKLFQQKMEEIFTLQDELDTHLEKNKILTVKAQHVTDLVNEKKRLVDLIAIEKQRRMTLYNLSNTQLHITPYMTTLDNDLIIQHNYLLTLNQRIVDSIAELETLEKERDELKTQLTAMESKQSQYSVDEIKKYMEKYINDLKEKEAEIERCKKLIRGNVEMQTASKEKNDQTRIQVSYRKTVEQQLKQTNKELRKTLNEEQMMLMKQSNDDSDLSFVTEPSAVMYEQSSARIRLQGKGNNKNRISQPQAIIQQSWNPKIKVPKAMISPRVRPKYAMRQ